ncbi:protein Aatf [Musca vetustissima]|uniref:protein Aatf n=1 Tax=Musca vetustissima TaxID=27455 RepID=UPI002AB729DB|nr:protein Aatf [Musca vetustissima]
MLKKTKSKQKSVAEKVAEIIAHPNESDSESENEALSRVRMVDFDEDEYQLPEVGTTEFRKRNVKLLSEQSSKYKGKIASRKDFEEDEEEQQYEESDDEEEDDDDEANESYEESDDDDEEALKKFGDVLKQSQVGYDDSEEDGEDEEEGGSGGEEDLDDNENDEDDEDGEEEDDDEEDDDDEEETQVISKVNRDAEIQKGICVQNQLKLWERLLEMRINFQKILAKSNQLPSPTELKELESKSDKNKSTTQEVTRQTQNLLQNLLTLQDNLYGQYSELSKTLKPTATKRPWPFKQKNNNDEPPIKQMNNYLQDRFDNFRSYRNTVLLKWDDRTKLLQPGAGAKKKSMNEEFDIIKKINNVLMNKSLLVQKSQQIKNNNQTQPNVENLENQVDATTNVNIYDDSDFYHQQLRELIEYKANTTSNMSEVTKQYLELQKLRQKMKKKVDTRASKGRKLRYIVHNKLINFMAPHDNCTWNDESKDELCKSLFV